MSSKMLTVFKSTIPSIQFIFKNGKSAAFVRGVYRTDFENEIKELNHEISLGHPHIYIDPEEKEVDAALVDPMVALEYKIRAQILAEIAAKNAELSNPANDLGNYESGDVNPASTRTIAAVAVGNQTVQQPVVTQVTTPKSTAPVTAETQPQPNSAEVSNKLAALMASNRAASAATSEGQ